MTAPSVTRIVLEGSAVATEEPTRKFYREDVTTATERIEATIKAIAFGGFSAFDGPALLDDIALLKGYIAEMESFLSAHADWEWDDDD